MHNPIWEFITKKWIPVRPEDINQIVVGPDASTHDYTYIMGQIVAANVEGKMVLGRFIWKHEIEGVGLIQDSSGIYYAGPINQLFTPGGVPHQYPRAGMFIKMGGMRHKKRLRRTRSRRRRMTRRR